jgi:hypothetical protein
MTEFTDLSEYVYSQRYARLGTKNIGWLGPRSIFSTLAPSEWLLSTIWAFCRTSVAEYRGLHECDFCANCDTNFTKRNSENLMLGYSEIRVFSKSGFIYAAPTLIYHYVKDHNYSPPAEFIEALHNGPQPDSQEYFDHLAGLELEWNRTYSPSEKPIRQPAYVRPVEGI